jgi:hypothetical protein
MRVCYLKLLFFEALFFADIYFDILRIGESSAEFWQGELVVVGVEELAAAVDRGQVDQLVQKFDSFIRESRLVRETTGCEAVVFDGNAQFASEAQFCQVRFH